MRAPQLQRGGYRGFAGVLASRFGGDGRAAEVASGVAATGAAAETPEPGVCNLGLTFTFARKAEGP